MGRLAGSLTRHLATTSRMYLEKCFFPLSCSSVGGGFWIVIRSTCSSSGKSNVTTQTAAAVLHMLAQAAPLATGTSEHCWRGIAFIGGKRAKGAWPCASSRTVMPKDQMSASALYLRRWACQC